MVQKSQILHNKISEVEEAGGMKFPSHLSIHPLTTISHDAIPPYLKDGFQ